ncbi:MAG: hypothetical protein GY774_34685 [Planctomycetes bacterium]|nr:hypothetical protein [Planctomycetota bacterium]
MKHASGKHPLISVLLFIFLLNPGGSGILLASDSNLKREKSRDGREDFRWKQEREFLPEPSLTIGKVLAVPFRIPEMVLRVAFFPIREFIEFEEEVDLGERTYDFLSNEDHTIFYYPTTTLSTLKFSREDGLTLGVAYYDTDVLDKGEKFKVKADVSTHKDFSSSLKYELPDVVASPLFYTFRLQYRQNGGELFYGIGNESYVDQESIYSEESAGVTLELGRKFNSLRLLTPYITVGYISTRTDTTEKRGNRSSIETVFDTENIVGFGESLDFLLYGLTLRYDSRLPAANPFQGNMLEVSFLRGDSLGRSPFSFNRFHLGLVQVFDVYKQNRTLSLGFQFERTDGLGKDVPFNYLSSLGEDAPLRGFKNGRFRDTGFILLNMEYSFPVWRGYEPPVTGLGTVFVDLGRTFDDIDDLKDGNLHYSVGTGLAFIIGISTYLRMQIGYGGEGIEFDAAMSRSF